MARCSHSARSVWPLCSRSRSSSSRRVGSASARKTRSVSASTRPICRYLPAYCKSGLTGSRNPAWLPPMAFEIRPVTPDRVDDFVAVVNPNRRATHCWCLSHRLTAREAAELGDGTREAAFQALCARLNPPGVVGYDDGEPVAWCSVGPRAENTRLSRSRVIRPLDDLPV